VKAKVSVTLDATLLRFVDRLPGTSRSDKLERVLRDFRRVREDLALRRALAGARERADERAEREAWTRTMEGDQWSDSPEATSGSSSS
jgi:metal-responsive CopG/Arc/MetJ family transcriptional regulator